MRSRSLDAHVEIELFSYDIKKRARAEHLQHFRNEALMGFEGFYVELLAILLMFGLGLTCSRARGICKIRCKRLKQLRFTCARMCAALLRGPHFEKEPASIPVVVGHF